MGKLLRNKDSSPRNAKYNHKPGWLVGMFHVLDFHYWRTKNRPICWKTPRTHSLMHETNEHEPFLDSVGRDSKKPSVVTEDAPTSQETEAKRVMMTTKQVTEYVDFLEILRKEDVFVKITKDSNSELRKQVQIKSSPRLLPKSGSFPLSGSSHPSRIEHKQRENWYDPKQNVTVLTLNVPKDTCQDHGFNQTVRKGYREIKKKLKNALKDRKNTKKKKSKSLDVPKDDHVGRYSKLLEPSFKREGGNLRSRSLKLSYEEKKSDSGDNKPRFFRRVSSLSSLEVLGSFLTDLHQDGSTRKFVDHDTNIGSKKSLLVYDSTVKTEEEEQRSPENHLDNLSPRIRKQVSDSVSNICSLDNTLIKTETSLSKGLTSSEIHNHEEEVEDGYFCYVKNVLEVSGFLKNKEWYSENQPLDPSLLYKLEIQEEVVVNKELLFDLVNEAISESESQYIYFPKAFSLSYPSEKRFLDEVWGRVKWSLSVLGDESRDRSLDDIVGRDLTKVDGWMNLRGESEWLTLELEDMILDDVLDELIFAYS